jgi:hypothetical protein
MILEQLGRIAPRDGGGVFGGSHIIASEAKQSIFRHGGDHGLLRFARNDGPLT